jgi:ribosome-binding protein aMBF1 (putative translation factor)
MATLQLTPDQAIVRLSRDLGLSTATLAQATGASPRTVERWRAGETLPQREARRRLAALLALDRRLRETFDSSEAIRAWLHSENRYLGGLTPAEAVQAGRVDRADAALEALDSGIFV